MEYSSTNFACSTPDEKPRTNIFIAADNHLNFIRLKQLLAAAPELKIYEVRQKPGSETEIEVVDGDGKEVIEEQPNYDVPDHFKTRAGRVLNVTRLFQRLHKILIDIGVPPKNKGYKYLREAIARCAARPTLINSITSELYPAVAAANDTSNTKVVRAIRHAIETAWSKGHLEEVNDLLGMPIFTNHQRPSNGEFIALVADKVMVEDNAFLPGPSTPF
jgi:hypothetical protein